jgi:Zn-dependent protease
MYIPEGTLQVGRPGSFSRIELGHLLIAIGVLTVAFSFTFSKNSVLFLLLGGTIDVQSYVLFMPIAFLGIVTAFFVHELSHKFVAQKYGLWSEFRMYPRALLFSFVLAFFTGLVFAAPGAVMFRGHTRPFETGRIAAAGPTSNIVITIVTYILYRFVFLKGDILVTVVGFICLVNSLLATFNLLPFGPLDGRKVVQWNGIVWCVLFSISAIFLGFLLSIGIALPGF